MHSHRSFEVVFMREDVRDIEILTLEQTGDSGFAEQLAS